MDAENKPKRRLTTGDRRSNSVETPVCTHLDKFERIEGKMDDLSQKEDANSKAIGLVHRRIDKIMGMITDLSNEVKVMLRREIEIARQEFDDRLESHVAAEQKEDALRLQMVAEQMKNIIDSANHRAETVMSAVLDVKKSNTVLQKMIIGAAIATITAGLSFIGTVIWFLISHAEEITKVIEAIQRVTK